MYQGLKVLCVPCKVIKARHTMHVWTLWSLKTKKNMWFLITGYKCLLVLQEILCPCIMRIIFTNSQDNEQILGTHGTNRCSTGTYFLLSWLVMLFLLNVQKMPTQHCCKSIEYIPVFQAFCPKWHHVQPKETPRLIFTPVLLTGLFFFFPKAPAEVLSWHKCMPCLYI